MRRAARFLVLSLLAAGPGTAQTAGPSGAALAASCISCHGAAGAGAGSIPAIAAPDAGALFARLAALRDAADQGPQIMPRLLRVYSDAELQALAAYFAKDRP